jgi:hypothetical protein
MRGAALHLPRVIAGSRGCRAYVLSRGSTCQCGNAHLNTNYCAWNKLHGKLNVKSALLQLQGSVAWSASTYFNCNTALGCLCDACLALRCLPPLSDVVRLVRLEFKHHWFGKWCVFITTSPKTSSLKWGIPIMAICGELPHTVYSPAVFPTLKRRDTTPRTSKGENSL